jgi:hypothetical protein
VWWTSHWEYISLEPTLDEILACFGPPDLYQSQYFADHPYMVFDLSLLYLDKGISVTAMRFLEDLEPPVVNGDVIMTDMTITAPGTAKEVIKYLYRPWFEEDEYDEMLKDWKPWPGSWEGIVVDTE